MQTFVVSYDIVTGAAQQISETNSNFLETTINYQEKDKFCIHHNFDCIALKPHILAHRLAVVVYVVEQRHRSLPHTISKI